MDSGLCTTTRRMFYALLLAGVVGHSPGALAQAQGPLAEDPSAVWSRTSSFDGVVEAERQTIVAAQVSGAVLEVLVKVGESVKAGQVLIQLDAQAAAQAATVQRAQLEAVRADLEVAGKDFERQKQLFQQDYISKAAFERAQARYQAAQAQAGAHQALSGAAQTQAGYYTLRAPYAGVVAEIPAMPGEMAMPGKPLLTLYDPSHLRVTAAVPQGALDPALSAQKVRIEIPGLTSPSAWITPATVKIFPTVDAPTHTQQVRLGLGPHPVALAPGQFARLWIPATQQSMTTLHVPLTAVVRRAEMTGLYVLDAQGHPLLRQVRLGRVLNDQVEVLSGLGSGERVAADAQAALTGAH